MATLAEPPVRGIGDNQPPTPFDALKAHIDDLDLEARNYLGGEPISTEAQAAAVSRILDDARKAVKAADEARKDEKRPHDEAAKAVQAKWQPLIGDAELVAATAKKALAPYLEAQEAAQRAVAEEARQAAEEAAEKARQAAQAAAPDNLAGQATARILQENAAAAAKQAKRLDKTRAHATGGERAVGLRTYYEAEITDPVAFIRWAWTHRQTDVTAFLQDLAATEARSGPRDIPGLKMTPQRKAV